MCGTRTFGTRLWRSDGFSAASTDSSTSMMRDTSRRRVPPATGIRSNTYDGPGSWAGKPYASGLERMSAVAMNIGT